MKRQLKRLTALILTLSMALGLVQINAFATDGGAATAEDILGSLYLVPSTEEEAHKHDHIYNGKGQTEDLADQTFYLHVIKSDKENESANGSKKVLNYEGEEYKLAEETDNSNNSTNGEGFVSTPSKNSQNILTKTEAETTFADNLVKVDLSKIPELKGATASWTNNIKATAPAEGNEKTQATDLDNKDKVTETVWVDGSSRKFEGAFEIDQLKINGGTLKVAVDPTDWQSATKAVKLTGTLTVEGTVLTAVNAGAKGTNTGDFKLVYAKDADSFEKSENAAEGKNTWRDATSAATLNQNGLATTYEEQEDWPTAYAIPSGLDPTQDLTQATNQKQKGNLFIEKSEGNEPTAKIELKAADIGSVATIESIKDVAYDGTNEPEITVKRGDETLQKGTDYEVEWGNNKSTGKAFVKVKGLSPRYTGELTKDFNIVGTDISNYDVTLAASASATAEDNKTDTFKYNDGKAVEPTVTVKSKDTSPKTLVKDTDYTLSFENNVDAGTATVTVTGKGGYSGTITKTFTISPKAEISDNDVSWVRENESFTYDGTAKEKAVTVTKDGTALVEGTDYTVTYENNVKSGTNTATAIVKGKGAYGGEVKKTFSIGTLEEANKIDLALAIADAPSIVYTGRAVSPVLNITYGDDKLSAYTEYTIDGYTDADGNAVTSLVEKGTYTAHLKAVNTSNFTGTKDVTFTIGDGLTAQNVADIPEQTIAKEGDKAEPEVVVTVGETTLVKGTDYTVEFKDNDKAGTATATITGIGNYAGTVTKTFTVKVDEGEVTPPPAEKLAAPVLTAFGKNSNKANCITVQWSEVEGADGYTVYRQAPGGEYEVLCKRAADAYSASSAGKQVNDTHFTAADHAKLYNYKVVAYKDDVEGEESNSESVIRMRSISLDATAMKVKGALNAKWDRVAGTGYLLQTATKSDFSDAKNKWIRPSKTNSWIRSKLPSGTNYVRVRAIRYYTAGDAWYYSAWSNTETVTVR